MPLLHPHVVFLGYVVLAQGVQVDGTKVQAIKEWSIPYFITQVRILHTIVSFYRRFVKNFSSILVPMTEVLRAKRFK